jgi:hypothetical protein
MQTQPQYLTQNLAFTDNPALRGREAQFSVHDVRLDKIVAAWRHSLFSHEWLMPDGTIRSFDSLPPQEKAKRREVEEMMQNGIELPRPVLGLGLADNIEIGAGRAVLLTLAAEGVAYLPVHLPNSCLELFADVLHN